MAWCNFGRQCPYSEFTLCQERLGCYGCGIYLDRKENQLLRANEIKAETDKVLEVHRAGL